MFETLAGLDQRSLVAFLAREEAIEVLSLPIEGVHTGALHRRPQDAVVETAGQLAEAVAFRVLVGPETRQFVVDPAEVVLRDRSFDLAPIALTHPRRTQPCDPGLIICLSFEKVGELGEFGGYHAVSDRDAFTEESGLEEPSCFLRHSNEREQQ